MAALVCFNVPMWLFLAILSGIYGEYTTKPTQNSLSPSSVVDQHIEHPVCIMQYGNTLECHVPVLDDNLDFSVYTNWINTVRVYCDKYRFLPSRLTNGMFETLGHTLKRINIDDCYIVNVSRYAFRGVTGLRELFIIGQSNSRSNKVCFQTSSISNSRQQFEPQLGLTPYKTICNADILVLPDGVFAELGNPISLKLVAMRLNSSVWHELQHLRNLQHLYLSNNNITSIDIIAISKLIILRGLYLNENYILNIPNGTFKSLRFLVFLGLSSNRITFIESGSFSGLSKLITLDLSANSVSTIEEESFKGLIKLSILNLSENAIRTTNMDTFQGLNALYILDMSQNKISSVARGTFQGLSKLNSLLLSRNSISTVELDTFKGLYELILLDLSENRIRIVKLDTFKGLSQLQRLDLSGNDLSIVEPYMFKGLSELKVLDLSGNSILGVEMDTFKELSTLSILNLSQNTIRIIAMGAFNGLSELQALELSSNAIRVLDKNIFMGLRTLKILNLSRNRLRTIKIGTFQGLIKVQSLILTENQVTTIAQHALSQLTPLLTLSLSNNHLQILPDLPSSLTSLDLRNNTIVEIDNCSFAGLPNLVDIDLSHNRIHKCTQYSIPHSIKWLNLSSNELTAMSFNMPSDLRYADFRNNQLKSLAVCNVMEYQIARKPGDIYLTDNGDSFQCTCNLEVLNNESTFNYHSKNNAQYHIWNFTSLICRSESKHDPGEVTTIPLEKFSCQYYTLCPDKCTCYRWKYVNKINIVNCLNAGLRSVPGNISATCTILDLSGNIFQSLMPGNFDGLSQLVELYLNSSNITDITEGTFRELLYLMKVDLSYNSISRLELGIFKGLNRLSFLDLSFNKISAIVEGTFNSLNALKDLNLAGNELEKISSSDIERIYTMTSLKLANNPWSCECSFLEIFKPFTSKREKHIKDYFGIVCLTLNKTEYHLYQVDLGKFCPDIKQPKRTTKAEIALYTLVSVTAFSIICFCIVFKNREFFKVWLFIKCGWKSPNSESEEINKQYDAFVSYSSRDEEFILRELMPRLEQPLQGRLGYKLCVHFRDFPVGRHIPETIHNAVENSRRVIMILSDNFLSSEWCQYEFQAAHHRLLTEKRNRIIMVLLHDLNSTLLDRQLKMYIRMRTYVKYGDALFWDKLEYAMPERKLPAEENSDTENIDDQIDSNPAVADEETDGDEQLIN